MDNPVFERKTVDWISKKRVGLALGGGGIRGIAHIPILKALDELGIRPTIIAGTSIGAIIGAMYARGLSGADIEQRIRKHILSSKDNVKSVFKKRKQLVKWARVFSPRMKRGGLVDADGLFQHLFQELVDTDFEDLDIPFLAVATELYCGNETVFQTGPVLPAVMSSMAIPGVFAPQKIDSGTYEGTYVDGGLVNNLPYDLLSSEADFSVAIDLMNLPEKPTNKRSKLPHTLDIAAAAVNIMQADALNKKLELTQPDVLIRTDLDRVGLFDFHKIEYVFARGEAAADQLRKKLNLLAANNPKAT